MSASARHVRRMPERQRHERAELDALLDQELVGHLAVVADGQPLVIPMAYARVGDDLLLHGSTGGGFALRAAAERATVAFAVTSLDGLVYARSLFDSSMNYRSAVVYGVLEPVSAEEEHEALVALSAHLMPGRPAEVRETTKKEYAATRALRLPIAEFVMKARAATASEAPDDGEDHTSWAGVVPLGRAWGEPEASPLTPAGTPVPESVLRLRGA
ncbi:pyridoxamine 5'-phosphate oxidase family protein [Agromyces mediolanus]|uniref:pyridoxamine 5'-phosphate oxidase family protein n=1 Tax=Agromyces mediolanus TaxID=41986 RepID=UPI00203F07D7|nr:pyridoxamine 5'-phosphate oxidase family protein [Agromyces mediolanus]MCM3658342.1 pyridoxamine 5'-phosphate oxidase family protein [Agromyces mediolanus]